MSLIRRIDAAVDGLCPCGGQPRKGSIYCGPDCEPTHLTEGTDRNGPGGVSWRHGVATPMRWRPDMVTEVDDAGLTMIGQPQRLRRFTRTAYSRDGTNRVHMRLDDGHRFVGRDVEYGQWRDSLGQRERVWQRLERELTDSDLVADDRADDGWFNLGWFNLGWFDNGRSRAEAFEVPQWQRLCPSCAQRGVPEAVVIFTPQGDGALAADEQMCTNCWYVYPPPALSGEVFESTTYDDLLVLRVADRADLTKVTYALSRRQFESVRHPRRWVQELWDQMNRDVVATYRGERE